MLAMALTPPTHRAGRRPYADLTPDAVLDALDGVGLRGDGRLIQLNSYENRVFQVFLEDGRVVVAKFYRPGRWSDAQILEEHAFAAELAAAEIPVVAPLALALDAARRTPTRRSAGATLARCDRRRRAIASASRERRAGRAPELDDPEVLRWLGRFIGRHPRRRRDGALSRTGRRSTSRPSASASRDCLLAHDVLRRRRRRRALARRSPTQALARMPRRLRRRRPARAAAAAWRLPSRQHPVDATPGPHFVDLDDARTGPAVQDLWMLLSGDRAPMTRQLLDVLDGYEAFMRLRPRASWRLIEPLRTLRMIHHSAWIARRWSDPAFPINFPWFGSRGLLGRPDARGCASSSRRWPSRRSAARAEAGPAPASARRALRPAARVDAPHVGRRDPRAGRPRRAAPGRTGCAARSSKCSLAFELLDQRDARR